ncbi:hypothetical protein GQ42DRAFT_158080 [Ramicandelaber brevisporus]|nr:hypothetical protein GQ42DRAFT_158080 [Ramicandelaber brevisporus]
MDICGDNIISINSSGNNDENGNGNNNISNNSNYSIARGNNSNSNIPAGHPYLSGSNRGYNRPNSATMGGIPVPIRGVGSGGPHSQFQSPLSAYPSGPPSAGFLASPLSATMGSPLNNIAASETSNKRKLSHEEAMQTVRERILARRAQQDPSNSSNNNPTSAANIGISDNSSASRLNNRRRHPHAPRTPSSATGPVSSTNDSIDNQRLESPLSSGLVSSVTAAKTHSANYGINTTSSNITGGNVTMSPNVRSSASPHGNLSPALQAIGSNKGRSASPLTVSATNNASSPYQLPAGSYQSQQYPQTSLSNANSNTSSLMTASIPTTTPLIPPRGSSTGAMSGGIVFQQYQSESQHHYQTQSHQPQLQHQLRGPTSPFVQPYSPQTQPPYQQQQQPQQQQMYHGQSQMQDEHAPISPVGTNAHVNSRNSSSSFGSSGSTNGMMRKLPYPVSTTTTPTNTTPSVRFPTIK